MSAKPKRCRHCRHPDRPVNRPRGLCWTCYYTPGLKDRYPSTSKFANHGIDQGRWKTLPLPEPTAARPNSPEKLAVLCARAEAGQELWHPNDAAE